MSFKLQAKESSLSSLKQKIEEIANYRSESSEIKLLVSQLVSSRSMKKVSLDELITAFMDGYY